MNRIRIALASLLLLAAGLAHAGQYSDVWYDPEESGWGVNVVQQEENAFVTLFVYGPDGRPTWYVAPDARITAYSSPGGFPVFSGTLYRAEGSWHGRPYDPSAGRLTGVGPLSLEVVARDRMRVHYSAEGVSVVKTVTRHTFAQQLHAATFTSVVLLRQSRPGEAPFGRLELQADVQLHMAGDGQGFLRMDDQLGRRCEFRGPYGQSGKLMRFSGSFTCSSGDAAAGTFEIADLEVSPNGITGTMRMDSPGLRQIGRFAAVLQ